MMVVSGINVKEANSAEAEGKTLHKLESLLNMRGRVGERDGGGALTVDIDYSVHNN